MTRTRTLTGYLEVIQQFIHDFQLPDPRSVFIYGEANHITIMLDGEGNTANLISESLYWETNEIGITTADVTFDGAHITVQVYES